jgi:hypothetical protein
MGVGTRLRAESGLTLMTVILVSSFVVFVAPAFAGLIWLLNRVADIDGARQMTGSQPFFHRPGSGH